MSKYIITEVCICIVQIVALITQIMHSIVPLAELHSVPKLPELHPPVTPTAAPVAQKSKLTAGLLAIFLGTLGIHNFYLGFTTKAIIQLVVSLLGAAAFGIGPVAIGIWALVEGIMILTGRINTDANGVALI